MRLQGATHVHAVPRTIRWLAAAAVLGSLARGAGADARLERVVAKVGAVAITVDDVERRMRAVPDFQLATFGASPRAIARQFVEQVMVREVLLAEGAKARKLEASPAVRERIAQSLRNARVEALRRGVSVTNEEVAAFFAENRGRFEAPERIGVYRILCATRGEAEAVLADAKASSGLPHWTELARERSTDKATRYRGGDLGFLAADGSSDEVSVKVDPALFAAARTVRDGEIVPEPVAEGDAFAVVWRRGSRPAIRRSVEEESSAIRQVLERRKAEQALTALLAELRRARAVETHPELLEELEVDGFGEVATPRRTAPQARDAAAARVVPSPTPRGLR